MVEESSHVKPESLIHLCKIGLIIHGYFSCIQPSKLGKYPELLYILGYSMFSLYFGGSLGGGAGRRGVDLSLEAASLVVMRRCKQPQVP
jgi:hypothetical protein